MSGEPTWEETLPLPVHCPHCSALSEVVAESSIDAQTGKADGRYTTWHCAKGHTWQEKHAEVDDG